MNCLPFSASTSFQHDNNRCNSNTNSKQKKQFSINDFLFSCIQEDDTSNNNGTATNSGFSCFEDSSSVSSTKLSKQNPTTTVPTAATTTTTTSYSTLTENNQNLKYIYISTKKPIWNTEINQWMHFFGGRVKIPSVHNFLGKFLLLNLSPLII
jgi:hypothetical protein